MLDTTTIGQTRRRFRAGEVIFPQGETGSSMISILTGFVRVIKDGVEIAHRGPGEFIGEMSLVEDSPRFATVVADSDCEIVECSRQEFLEVIKEDPAFALSVMRSLSQKLRESDSLRIRELEESNLNLTVKNKELSLINDFLEQLVEQSPAAIVITNKRGTVKRANPAARKIFNIDPAQVSNSLQSFFVDCNPIENLWRSLEPSWVGECKVNVRGQVRTLYLSVSRLYSYDPESSYLFICEDISELIELNEQIIKLERFATEAEIASGIAHDIKNYLTVLRGNFELIQLTLDEHFKQQHQRHIQAMEKALHEIDSFLENLMGGRGDGGDVALKNLDEMVRVMVKFLAPQKRFRHIKLTVATDPAFPPLVRINETQFQQILLNLLINAADALSEAQKEEPKEIRIELGYEAASSKAAIVIADNGPGIPLENQPELFTKRFTTKKRGHGIGLITVKKIIDQHQGTIEVDSTPGRGTKFTITLPVQR